jgi:hypothetical protein
VLELCISREGWEKLGLYEYYKEKQRAIENRLKRERRSESTGSSSSRSRSDRLFIFIYVFLIYTKYFAEIHVRLVGAGADHQMKNEKYHRRKGNKTMRNCNDAGQANGIEMIYLLYLLTAIKLDAFSLFYSQKQ